MSTSHVRHRNPEASPTFPLLLAFALAVTACGGGSAPAGGSGGAGGGPGPSSGAGGTSGTGGSAPQSGNDAGGRIDATVGTGGTTGAGGSDAPDASANGGDARLDGQAVDSARDSVAPDLGVDAVGDTRASDAAGTGFCPKTISGGKVRGVSAADFCATFETTCKFFSGGVHYMSTADCLQKYNALSDALKACRAAALCQAVRGDGQTFCVSASGFATPYCSPDP